MRLTGKSFFEDVVSISSLVQQINYSLFLEWWTQPMKVGTKYKIIFGSFTHAYLT